MFNQYQNVQNNISCYPGNILEFIEIFKENTMKIYKAILTEKNILFIGHDNKV